MYVKKNSCKNGRILLTLTHGYRENGKIKQKNIETLGYLDDLEKIYTDPIAHFREIAKQRTEVYLTANDELGYSRADIYKRLTTEIREFASSKEI